MTRVMRILGMITGAMVFWQLGPEHIWGEATGHIVALVKKFPLRTIITLPIILGIAHWFVF